MLSPGRLFATPRTEAHQVPLTMEFSRQEYWSGLPFPSPCEECEMRTIVQWFEHSLVKQEMARVNVDSLGISEVKWTGMGELNSDDHYIYYYGPESLRRNGLAIIVN